MTDRDTCFWRCAPVCARTCRVFPVSSLRMRRRTAVETPSAGRLLPADIPSCIRNISKERYFNTQTLRQRGRLSVCRFGDIFGNKKRRRNLRKHYNVKCDIVKQMSRVIWRRAASPPHPPSHTSGFDVLSCSLAVLDPRVGHTMDVLAPFISVLCHSD